MRRIIFFLGLVLLAALAFIAYRGQSWLVKFADRKAEEVLAAPVEFSDLSPRFQVGSVTFRRVKIFHPDRKAETIGEVKEVTVRLRSLSELFHRSKAVEVVLHHPRFVFATTRTGDWELAGRIPLILTGTAQARLAPFNVEKISVKEGEVEFRDGRVSQPPTVTRLSKVEAVLDRFRLPTLTEPLPVQFQARGLLQDSASFDVKGKGDFLSPKISFSADLKMNGLPLPFYAPYYEGTLPVHVRGGLALLSGHLQCQGDILHGPLHASVLGLVVDLKKNKAFEFAADDAVNSLKDKNGNVPMDFLVTGDLRRPRFVVLTDFEGAALGGVPKALKGTGHKISEGTKAGWRKVKGVFD